MKNKYIIKVHVYKIKNCVMYCYMVTPIVLCTEIQSFNIIFI